MSSWRALRRLLYGGVFILIVALIGAGIFWQLFYKTPTCSDGKKNGDETGVDCGGSCKLLCTSDALTPVVLWSKIFKISGDIYSAVAYIQNPNINSKNEKAAYQFRVYDINNKLITVKEGQTSIPKNKKFAVFEIGLILKNQKPKSADFEFISLSPWQKDSSKEPNISLTYSTLLSSSTSPKIEGSISNDSLENISKVELDAFVLDNNENVIGASRTFIDNLKSRDKEDFVFTWQSPFEANASVVNVTYRSL